MDIDKIRRSAGIIGESDEVQEMLALIGQVANTDISVLITGESGSGKDLVAKAIHKNSRRKFENLVIVNCAAIPAGIIESELFGHKKGSFTGATESRTGYFEAAHKGSIFLDEIGELPLETQAKLLRVIEQGEFMRVGDTKIQKTDVRVIAATNRDLAEEVKKSNFRQDLYFRLKTINIEVAPLRDHISDLHLFIERFGLEFTAKNDIPFKGFSAEAQAVLKHYDWPGNVRELKNLVESILVMNKGERITEDMVKKQLKLDTYNTNPNLPVFVNDNPDKVERELILKQLLFLRQDVNEIKQMITGGRMGTVEEVHPANPALYLPPPASDQNQVSPVMTNIEDGTAHAIQEDAIGETTMAELEHEMIERALEKFRGNRRKTARALDISERTLYRKINDYGIQKKFKY
ncbi:MAG: sigma-54 dependent transcriptional regulator [Candidatus Marinimicrobia bacterium]|nr:sigma-54 dependent transcriptional regulator [Candidatus Neomarinimicrobiota bacterium]